MDCIVDFFFILVWEQRDIDNETQKDITFLF